MMYIIYLFNSQAVRQTGADTAEGAIAWVFENQEMAGASADDPPEMYQEYKMVFVVNSSLPMTPGKMAAQVNYIISNTFSKCNCVDDK